MTARHLDQLLDTLNREITQKTAAEATAWRAIDLVTQWCELILEEPHTPVEAHLANTDRLLMTSKMFLESAPNYAPGLSGAGEAPDRPGAA